MRLKYVDTYPEFDHKIALRLTFEDETSPSKLQDFSLVFCKGESIKNVIYLLRDFAEMILDRTSLPLIRIEGSEIPFHKECTVEELREVVEDIWLHPDKYSDYKPGTDGAYYGFLKYLWINYPDGTSEQLAAYAKGEKYFK